MDGAFHYVNKIVGIEYTKEIDEIKTKLAKENGYYVIRIDCNYQSNVDKFEYIKASIINSLSNIFYLSEIDWRKIEENIVPSYLIKACELWNSGMTTEEISHSLNISIISIIEYLKRGCKVDLCWYSKELSNLRQAKNISKRHYNYCIALNYDTQEPIGTFYDIDNFIYNYNLQYNKYLNKQAIRQIINQEKDYMHGPTILNCIFTRFQNRSMSNCFMMIH